MKMETWDKLYALQYLGEVVINATEGTGYLKGAAYTVSMPSLCLRFIARDDEVIISANPAVEAAGLIPALDNFWNKMTAKNVQVIVPKFLKRLVWDSVMWKVVED